ncbi:YjbQ family protein [Legionella sp. MW5194]|uniref:secondary thiamine-phosphate synthase enzyme YjbQ n=1 Tax=Legionella sp. MW5194 TaxID=2662448 RepID=UPI00193EBCB4|nr:secondary thiamine-phosphate synthase enzyme YjbQ [Legionella sp. MW5194]QRN03243.1 YjbQ family protein [Legionella sp. MW5194]
MDKAEKRPIYWQTEWVLNPLSRGFHLITPALQEQLRHAPFVHTGLAHLFLKHTSASLAISENTCADVPMDLETHLNRLVPDNNQLYRHTLEGEDDMPAHIKNVMLGASLTLPLCEGRLTLGQWQGIFLAEHRNEAPARRLVITVHGI